MTSITPTEDRVAVQPDEAEQVTSFGLVIPDNAKTTPTEGVVVAVGPGRRLDNGKLVPMDVAVGDRVIYSKYAGTEVTHDGEKLFILKLEEVLAVI